MKIDFKKYIPIYIAAGVAFLFLIISAGGYAKKGYGKSYEYDAQI